MENEAIIEWNLTEHILLITIHVKNNEIQVPNKSRVDEFPLSTSSGRQSIFTISCVIKRSILPFDPNNSKGSRTLYTQIKTRSVA